VGNSCPIVMVNVFQVLRGGSCDGLTDVLRRLVGRTETWETEIVIGEAVVSWIQRYQVRHYFRNSIWILPLLSIVLALAAVPWLHDLEKSMGWESSINPETARTVLGMMAASMFTFIVFVCSALLIAVQLASAQLTPRIIALVFRDPVTKFSLTVFVFTFTFSLAVLVRINAEVPVLTARLSAYSCIVCVGIFLYLIDHVGKWLRPSGALRAVALLGREVIENVYPRRFSEVRKTGVETAVILDRDQVRTVTCLRNGVVLAFDVQGLVSMAQRADCIIEMVPQVGDFLAVGDPLFRIYQGGDWLADDDLRHSVAVGQERTLEQDPALAFRIIVDIASKGLSPAINDPTTAVLAIDQIHHLLRIVGGRSLDDERVRDATGRTRLVFRTPAWEDFVQLAVTEIRHFGGASIQVARRLRAMLQNLMETLPPARAAVLRYELSLLQRSAERFFPDPEDRAMAEIGDFQGVGSKEGQGSHGQEPGEPKPQ
jgi:uncharacterized membrane protein